MKNKTTSPGHHDAIKIGCKCPVIDNGYGAGSSMVDKDGNPMYWYNFDCPIHGGENTQPLDGKEMVYSQNLNIFNISAFFILIVAFAALAN